MKLRFGIGEASLVRMRDALDASCREPPVGRRLSYVYLDTPEGDLAERDVALRFRRSAAVGASAPARPWRRQAVWPKSAKKSARSLKTLGIRRLKQRVDATFTVRIERWTWRPEDDWASVSLDRSTVSTGAREESFAELRVVCRRKHVDRAMAFAVTLGAMHLASRRARERGQAMLAA